MKRPGNSEKQLNKKRMKFIRIVVLIIFALFILIADVLLLFNHSKTYSSTENRMLQQAPSLTSTNLSSGKFMTEVEDFISDQFFARDSWISLKLSLDKLTGKSESNGVYLGKNNYLIEAPVETGSHYEENLEAINSFAQRHSDLNIVMSVIPNTAYVCSQLLPANAPVIDQGEIISDIESKVSGSLTYIDTSDVLKSHREEYIFYRSDHHWTSLGAKYAFEAIAPSLGIEGLVSDYATYTVTNDFSGTMAATSGATYVYDSIDIYVPNTDVEYVVEYVGENKKVATIYSSESLEGSSKYEVFLGGNYSQVNINTTNLNDKRLLILKDSYANAFIQFLTPYYNEIVIVDPRYYSDNIETLITDNEITDILFLYNVNTFVEDNNIAGVLNDQ